MSRFAQLPDRRRIERAVDDRLLLLNAALVTVRDGGLDRLGPDGQLFLEAVRRSKNDLANASPEAIGDYLREFDEEQLRGVVSNVKGIAHEMMVAEAENSDGDTVFAELYPDTNHPTFDLMLTDVATGEQLRPRQVKATSRHHSKPCFLGNDTLHVAGMLSGLCAVGHLWLSRRADNL